MWYKTIEVKIMLIVCGIHNLMIRSKYVPTQQPFKQIIKSQCNGYIPKENDQGPAVCPSVKGDGNPDDNSVFFMRDLNKPWILILVSSKSVEKLRSCGRLNIYKWTVMEAAIL